MPISNPTAAISFSELAGGQNKQPTADATWEDWDLSAVVPEGTLYAEIVFGHRYNTVSNVLGVRAKGSALNRYGALDQGVKTETRWECSCTVAIDAARLCQIYAQWQGYAYFNCIGYWM